MRKGLRVTFWGVRGSVCTPVPENMFFGGNTPCIEVRRGDAPPIILDGGSGIRLLGDKMMKESGGLPGPVHVFLTHFHYDHIQGIPFFPLLYHAGTPVHFYSMDPSLRDLLTGQMAKPYFPVQLPDTENYFHQIPPEGLIVEGTRVIPFALRHSDPVSGFRLEAPEGIVVYASDHEHGEAHFDEGLVRAAQGADLLIYDAHFTPEEYPQRTGWGHSTWLEAAKIARASGARRLALFHHAPERSDSEMKSVVLQAKRHFAGVFAARERQTVEIGRPARPGV